MVPETGEALVTVVTMEVSVELADDLDEQLVDRAGAEGLKLTGEGGLRGRLTKVVVEFALENEIDDHLDYCKHDPAGRSRGNFRNGTRTKPLVAEAGSVEIEMPRGRRRTWPKSTARRSPSRPSSTITDRVMNRP